MRNQSRVFGGRCQSTSGQSWCLPQIESFSGFDCDDCSRSGAAGSDAATAGRRGNISIQPHKLAAAYPCRNQSSLNRSRNSSMISSKRVNASAFI